MALEPTLEAAPVGVAQDDLLPAVRGLLDHEFDVVGRLGVGGMATVYLAYERALARFVALKVMHPALVASSQMRERFLREARLAAALDHRNVVPIHGLRETGGLIILVLRAVMGRSLAAILADHGPLPIPVVQRVVAQVAGALHHAHKRGIIHRDVKPGNILIDEDGTVVVSDFGIAKALEAPEITSTGHAVGTPAYMSPEQCDGRAVTPASDQYGLGAVAYEMLSGHPPFRADSAMGIMYAQTHTDPTPLPEVRAGVPLAMALAVQRMLTKDPAGRWPDLDDVVRNVGRPPLVDGLDDPSAEELARLARSGSPGIALSASYVPTPPRLRRTDPDAATLLVWGTGPRRWGRPAAIAGLGLAAIAGLLAWPAPAPAPVEPLPARTESLPPAPRPAPAPAPQADAPATPPIRRVLDPRRDTLAARRDIDALLRRFGQAVESRKIAQVIAAYPALPPGEQREWEQRFASSWALRLDISVRKLSWNDRGAEAELRGFLAYTPRGSTTRKVDDWDRKADLALGPEGWRLVRLH